MPSIGLVSDSAWTRSSVCSSSSRSSDSSMRARSTSCATSSACGQELVQRRVEQPDRDRQAAPSPRTGPRSPPAGAAAARRARARRSSSVSAMIIARIFGWRSAAMNMCSVRHRPMPSAPNSRALRGVLGRVGVGAHAERAQLVGPARAPSRKLLASTSRLHERHVVGRDDARRVPSIAIRSPSREHGRRPRARVFAVEVDLERGRARHARLAHPARDQRRVAGLAALAR